MEDDIHNYLSKLSCFVEHPVLDQTKGAALNRALPSLQLYAYSHNLSNLSMY